MTSNSLVIYKSSAGSGKTYTLVLEYLKLVLINPALYRSILAITFTNKATEEMKSRIIGALVEISENKNEVLQKEVSTQTGLAGPELPGRAGKVLDYILHDYSGFGVSTIDSFFSTIVRALARELNLPLRFDIELNTDAVIKEISSMLLDDISSNKWLKQWLEEFIFDKLDQGRSWKIEDDIYGLALELFKESYMKTFAGGHSKPDPALISELRKIITDFETAMAAFGNEFIKLIQEHHLDITDFAYGKSGVANYFKKITVRQKPADYQPGKRFEDARLNYTLWTTKSSLRKDEIETLARNKLIPLADKIQVLLEAELPRYAGARSVLATVHIAGILSLLDEKLRIFRDENDLVLISDTNQLLQKAIKGDDAPFIYEKTGNRYSHFMLDEFQDTSDFQWQNLLPLIDNALGAGNYTMIVGDAKQSIYRWRGGNLQLLLTGVQGDLLHYNKITQLKNLSENYRSRHQVVNFNNEFFEFAPALLLPGGENEIHRIAYHSDGLKQQWKRGIENEGYVSIRILERSAMKNMSTDEDQAVSETEEDTWIKAACRENLAILTKVLSAGFEFRDIAFLTRTNKDAKIITGYLMENGIHQIISPESMLLNQSPKIQFLINLLRFIDDNNDDILLAEIVYYWNVIIKKHNSLTSHQLFSETRKNKLDLLPESFSKKLISLRKIPLYETVEELSIVFELGPAPEAYLQRFFDLVLEYTRNNPANITDFLKWWDDNQEKDTCSVVIPSGENAIRVMSIHKSKGLQFPVVIVPFADWDLKPKSQSILWVSSTAPPFNNSIAFPVKSSAELELSVFADDYRKETKLNYIDNLNLLYVAFTRAEEQLYVVTQRPSENKKKTDSGLPGCAGELIVGTLKQNQNMASFLNDATGIFEQGVFAPPLRKPREKGDSRILEHWFATSWKPRIKMGISKNKISIHDPETPETQYGLLFHKLVADIQSVVNAETFVKTHVASRDSDTLIQQRLIKEIGMFMEIAQSNHWFSSDSHTLNEVELLMPDGSILRPDRLILTGKKAVVIDYKTGVEENFHRGQVQQYASVLTQMGYEETKMFLVYPATKNVVEITAA